MLSPTSLLLTVTMLGAGTVCIGELAADDRPHVSLEVDLIQIENKCLKDLAEVPTPANRVVQLDDVQAFVLRSILEENRGQRGFVARPKAIHAFGIPLEFSTHTDAKTAIPAVIRKDAWYDQRSFTFELTPRMASGELTLTLSFKSNGQEQIRGPAIAADGGTMLNLLDKSEGIWRAALLTPRVVESD